MPVYDKAQFTIAQLEVGQYLRHVNWEKFLNAFILNDDAVFNQHIHTEAGVNYMTIIFNRLDNLTFNNYTTFSQLKRQAGLVGLFEQARAQGFMNLDG